MISTVRPPASLAKSSAASSAPTSEPLPTWSANGPEKSPQYADLDLVAGNLGIRGRGEAGQRRGGQRGAEERPLEP